MVQLKNPDGYLSYVNEPLLLSVVSFQINSEALPKCFGGEPTSLAEEPWRLYFYCITILD